MEAQHYIQKALDEIGKRLQRIDEKLGEARTAKNDWLDNQEICQLLHISKRTLENYRCRGMLPFSKVGGKVYYRMNDINDFLNAHIVRKEEKL